MLEVPGKFRISSGVQLRGHYAPPRGGIAGCFYVFCVFHGDGGLTRPVAFSYLSLRNHRAMYAGVWGSVGTACTLATQNCTNLHRPTQQRGGTHGTVV